MLARSGQSGVSGATLGGIAAGVALLLLAVILLLARGHLTVTSASGQAAGPVVQKTLLLTTSEGTLSTEAHLVAVVLSGTMPAGPTTATVLSDSNCDPDAQGISHCLNDIKLQDGTVLKLRHNHAMGHPECLNPGETVRVVVDA